MSAVQELQRAMHDLALAQLKLNEGALAQTVRDLARQVFGRSRRGVDVVEKSRIEADALAEVRGLLVTPPAHYCPDCEAHIPASDCFKALDAKGGMSLAHYGPEVEHGGYGRGTMDAPTTHWVES